MKCAAIFFAACLSCVPAAAQSPATLSLSQTSFTEPFGWFFGTIVPSAQYDVAYDAASDIYCVATVATNAAAASVRITRYLGDGTPFGGTLTIPGQARRVTVANARRTGMFVIAWVAEGTLVNGHLMAVQLPATGSLASTILTVATGVVGTPDMASDPSGLDDETLVVWADGSGVVVADLRTNSTIQVWSTLRITNDPQAVAPRISKCLDSQGGAYAYCVVWAAPAPSIVLGAPDQWEIYAALINPNIGLYGTPIRVSSSSIVDDRFPDVDGNGAEFVVAWVRNVATSSAVDVVCRRLIVGPGAQLVTSGPVVAVGAGVANLQGPTVAWRGPRYAIAYQEWESNLARWCTAPGPSTGLTGPRYRNVLVNYDAASGSSVRRAVLGEGLHPNNGPLMPCLVADRSGAQGAGEDGLAVWLEECYEYVNGVEQTHFEARGGFLSDFCGGSVIDDGGGCGAGGSLTTDSAPAIGNADFAISLTGGDPGALLAVVVVGSGPGNPCGPCVLTNPSIGSWTQGYLNGGFTSVIPIPVLPNLIGLQVVWQAALWLSNGPCALLPFLAISNRLQTTLDW